MLHRIYGLGAAIRYKGDVAAWPTTCPLCCEPLARAFAPDPDEPLELGTLVCDGRCKEQHGHFDLNAATGGPAMDEEYTREADVELAAWLGFPSVDVAFNREKYGLEAALPKFIDIDRSREAVLADALEAVKRYGDHLGDRPEGSLLEVARWQRLGAPVGTLPDWLPLAVRERVMRERAVALVVPAIERVRLNCKRPGVTVPELRQEEPAAFEEAARLLGYDFASNQSLGWMLRDLALKPGEEPPGIRQVLGRGASGRRWEVVHADPVSDNTEGKNENTTEIHWVSKPL